MKITHIRLDGAFGTSQIYESRFRTPQRAPRLGWTAEAPEKMEGSYSPGPPSSRTGYWALKGPQ